VPKAQRDLAALQVRLGYRFKDYALFELALTHVSAIRSDQTRLDSYQRLEFLGDRVLGLAIADMLSAAFPAADEGELARRLADLVRKETCADIAVLWELGDNLRLGAGEVQSGGRKRVTILADACEALIGAIYLDSDFPAAKQVIAVAWGDRVKEAAGDRRDAKTQLQELAQGRGIGTPTYREVERSGPAHRMTFVVAVDAAALGRAEGTGTSKREAEQAAARSLLAVLAGMDSAL
jgi:ribonuclease III